MCRNRSVDILKERPDLVEQMNRFREKVSNVLKIVCRKSSYIDNTHSMTGIRLWFESGQDVYDFIIRQPEFDWEVVPTLDVININRCSSRLVFCKSVHYYYSCTNMCGLSSSSNSCSTHCIVLSWFLHYPVYIEYYIFYIIRFFTHCK
jgi:hypothetical protein